MTLKDLDIFKIKKKEIFNRKIVQKYLVHQLKNKREQKQQKKQNKFY